VISDTSPRANDLSLLRGDDVPHPGRVGQIECTSFSNNTLESNVRPMVNMPWRYMTRVELELLPDSAYASVRPSESSRYFSGAGVCEDMMCGKLALVNLGKIFLSIYISATTWHCCRRSVVTGTPVPHSDHKIHIRT
jgi:hypothetical protein